MADGGQVVQLATVETHRVVAILEETLEKLSFLGSITPDVLQHRDELSHFVGAEISRIIQEQRQLETRYEELIARRGTLKGLANKNKYKDNQAEIQAVSMALRESTKNLCRNLKDNPNISGNLLKIQKERQELAELLAGSVAEVRETGRFDALRQHVAGQLAEQDKVKALVEREHETDEAVRALDAALLKEKEEHRVEKEKHEGEIAALKEQLGQLKSKSSVHTAFKRRDARSATQTVMRLFQREERESSTTIGALSVVKHVEGEVAGRIHDFLKKKKEALLTERVDWNIQLKNEVEGREGAIAAATAARGEQEAVLQGKTGKEGNEGKKKE